MNQWIPVGIDSCEEEEEENAAEDKNPCAK